MLQHILNPDAAAVDGRVIRTQALFDIRVLPPIFLLKFLAGDSQLLLRVFLHLPDSCRVPFFVIIEGIVYIENHFFNHGFSPFLSLSQSCQIWGTPAAKEYRHRSAVIQISWLYHRVFVSFPSREMP